MSTLIFDIAVMGAFPAAVGWHAIRNHYGEFFRPLIGKLLFRKPKMRTNMDLNHLFRVGNHGSPVTCVRDLERSYKNLHDYLERSSWYRYRDQQILRRCFEHALPQIAEAEQRARQRQRESAKKKQSAKTANVPISGWRKILGVDAHCMDSKVIKTLYRKAVSKDHPDKGGTGKKMPELNRALEAARKELDFV